VSSWKELTEPIRLVSKAAGIFKPRGSAEALSVRWTLDGSYENRFIVDSAGGWIFIYRQQDDPQSWPNRALKRAIKEGSSVGVVIQLSGKPNGQYFVAGIGQVAEHHSGHFQIRGLDRLDLKELPDSDRIEFRHTLGSVGFNRDLPDLDYTGHAINNGAVFMDSRTVLDRGEELIIRPEVGMYAAFSRLNYKPWYALAEYVDNALQSHIQRKAELVAVHGHWPVLDVRIEIDAHRIVISDNAGGIAGTDIQRAFRPAKPPPDSSGLSEFGLGMKAASSWFARAWAVHTSAVGESTERVMRLDIERIVREERESIRPEINDAKPDAHYTVITLEPLRRTWTGGRTLGKIRMHLQSMYRRFFEPSDPSLPKLNLTIRYPKGEVHELGFEPVEIVSMPVLNCRTYWTEGRMSDLEHHLWRREVDIALGSGRSVKGWVGIARKMSSANAGFAVFRRGRLILGGHEDGWRPEETHPNPGSYAYKSIVGELDVHGFDVSHTKDGIDWGEDEETIVRELRAAIRDPRLNIHSQTENWVRKPKKDVSIGVSRPGSPAAALRSVKTEIETRGGKAIASSQGVSIPDEPGGLSGHGSVQGGQMSSNNDDSLPDSAEEEVSLAVPSPPTSMEIKHEDKSWLIHMEFGDLQTKHRWYEYERTVDPLEHDEELTVRVNSSHEFSQTWMSESEQSQTAFLRFAVFLAISEHLAIDNPIKNPAAIRSHFNKLLFAFGGPE
jgi:hypothetical protein